MRFATRLKFYVIILALIGFMYFISYRTTPERKPSSITEKHTFLSSECSERATIEGGTKQNVIAFSLFTLKSAKPTEFKERFLPGVLGNYKRIQQLYPGWLMRVYTNVPIKTSYLKGLQNKRNLFFCDVTNLPVLGDVSDVHPPAWRFLAISDPTVATLLSRDLDSLINERERSAVLDWESSDKVFHAMRDHIAHKSIVMAGLWGVKTQLLNKTSRQDLKNAFIKGARNEKNFNYGKDQDVLAEKLYKGFKDEFMIHDSYHCEHFKDSIPFPKERTDLTYFVGSYFYAPPYLTKAYPCPIQCRPPHGKDWEYC